MDEYENKTKDLSEQCKKLGEEKHDSSLLDQINKLTKRDDKVWIYKTVAVAGFALVSGYIIIRGR